jgi:cytochrome b6-f complex iron-sulfur subunit
LSDKDPGKTENREEDLPRRSFFRKVWLILGALATFQLGWIAFDLLKPRNRRREAAAAGGIYVAGPLERFELGSVTAFPEGRFYLSRLDSGGFLALGRTCTHLGCTVPWIEADRQFACPCHASVFDITGEVLSPPADRALDMFAVRIENGIVKVDLSRAIKRRGFETEQVTMP